MIVSLEFVGCIPAYGCPRRADETGGDLPDTGGAGNGAQRGFAEKELFFAARDDGRGAYIGPIASHVSIR
jgi:hypothetical protein